MFDNQTYLTGTVRANRKNMPKSFRNMKLQKGERVVRQSGAIMALMYGDRKTVCPFSSISLGNRMNTWPASPFLLTGIISN
jgi:hypothetical protein